MKREKIENIWIQDDSVWIRDIDGRVASEPLSDYPRLKYASEEELAQFVVSESGVHWPALDEDLSFEGFFHKQPKTYLYQFFIKHPELNASAIARRLGISQSLFAQYISGQKKPSEERYALILNEIRQIGKELTAI